MKKRLILFVLALFTFFSAWAQTFRFGDIYYNITNEAARTVEVGRHYGVCSDNVVIPASVVYKGYEYKVTSIGKYAFEDCSGLTEVVFPENVTSIGEFAFSDCTGMIKISLPEGLISIGIRAFSDCSGLTEVVIPENVMSIGESAFSDCTGMTKISLPEGLTNIGRHAFSDCTSLTEVVIPENVTSIGEFAFTDCYNLTSVVWNAKSCEDFTLRYNPFDCSRIKSFTFGNTVEYIPAFLCSGMENQASVILPEGLTSIGDGAFYNCYGLKEIVIPENVTSIGEAAFFGCLGLTEISLPRGLTSIEGGTFQSCTGLTEMTIPERVTNIGYGAFQDCCGLMTINFPESLTSIEKRAFSDCTGLTEITIPKGVTSIGEYAFSYCTNLTRISISEGLTSLEAHTFSGCDSLALIALPASLTSIGSEALGCASKLQSLYCRAVMPPAIVGNPFVGTPPSANLYVPCGAEDDYRNSSYWATFENIIGLESQINVVSNNEVWGTVTVTSSTGCGGEAVIEATPAEGYLFVRWSDGNTDNPRVLTVTKDVTLTAEFAPIYSAVEEVHNEGAIVTTAPGVILVYGVAGCELSVYSLQGMCFFRGTVADNPAEVGVPSTGVYMVVAGEDRLKAIVR